MRKTRSVAKCKEWCGYRARDDRDLVVLAGGDVQLGWRAFVKVGLDHTLRKEARSGAVVVGISAGASSESE